MLQDSIKCFRAFAFDFLLPKFIMLELENAKRKFVISQNNLLNCNYTYIVHFYTERVYLIKCEI